MNIVRKIILNELGCYQIKESEKKLFKFVKCNLLGLKPVNMSNSDYIMYANSDNENIFQYNIKSYYLYVNQNLIWSKLESEFGYSYDETKNFIKIVAEQAYKLKNVTPEFALLVYQN